MYLKSRKALRLSMSIIKLNLASERAVQVHADRKRCRLTVAAEHNVEQKPDKRNGYPVVKSYLEMQEGKVCHPFPLMLERQQACDSSRGWRLEEGKERAEDGRESI